MIWEHVTGIKVYGGLVGHGTSEGQSVLGEGLDGATCKQIRVLQCVSGE